MSKEAQIIAVENQKGGVGKTTIALTLAAGLAAKGLEVVAVDTDAQGSLSKLMGYPDENGLYRAIVEEALLADVMHRVKVERWSGDAANQFYFEGSLYVLPGATDTARIPSLRPDDIYMMLDLMKGIQEQVQPDVIIVDTSPSLSGLTGALRLALDWLLYVTECEPLALDGLTKALQQMMRQSNKRAEYMGKETRIMGIVPNKLNPKTVLHRELVSQIGKAYGDLVWQPIGDRIDWANATYFRVPVFVSAPRKQAAKDAWCLIDHALEVLNAQSI
jgi:chromosome partitioning protein